MDENGNQLQSEIDDNGAYEEIPIENTSIYLGLPIRFSKDECSLHGKGVIQSMKENIKRLGQSSLNIAHNLEGVKFMELPGIGYRVMCADLTDADMEKFDGWLRGEIARWLRIHGVPIGTFGVSWRDGGFTIPCLQERENTMAIRTVSDIMRSADSRFKKMMDLFEREQAEVIGMRWAERKNSNGTQDVLMREGVGPDRRTYPQAKMQSIFPRAFRASQLSDISVSIKKLNPHLNHELATAFINCKLSRPAMCITQKVIRKVHFAAFRNKVTASPGWID
jgi:hypothetical protein